MNLKVKGEKCEFLQKEITFLGLKFTVEGTKPDPEKIANMVKVQAGEVRSFLGMANTCHEYTPDYAALTSPLSSGRSSVSQNKLSQLILGNIYILKYLQSNFIG